MINHHELYYGNKYYNPININAKSEKYWFLNLLKNNINQL